MAKNPFTSPLSLFVHSNCDLAARKVDARLPEKRHSNSHCARPVHQIISMIKWIPTSRLSIQKRRSLCDLAAHRPLSLAFIEIVTYVQSNCDSFIVNWTLPPVARISRVPEHTAAGFTR